MTTAILCGLLVLLLLVGARLFVVVGAVTAVSFVLFVSSGHVDLQELERLVTKMEGLAGKNVFLSIPFFVTAGNVMTSGSIASRLIEVARAAVGFLPGGLAIAAVFASVVFAAISGSSPVTLVAVGSIMFPALIKAGYPERFSIGLLSTAGSLGCLVPPSISILIYAISVSGSASVEPADLYLAGFVPAVFVAGLLGFYAFWVGRTVPSAQEKFSWERLRLAIREASWSLLLPVLVMGGIYTGAFTPTEAGAVALVYAVFLTVYVYRDVDVYKVPEVLVQSAILIGSLVLIVVLAFGLNDLLAEVEAAEHIAQMLRNANLSPFTFLLLVNAILIVLGALMDSISATLVFAPILAPIAVQVYGMDPLHFGVVFVVNMEIGYIAPPVATNLFVAAAIFKKPFGQVMRAIFPTLGIVTAALVVLMYVPTLSKAALNWKKGLPVYQAFLWNGPSSESQALPTESSTPSTQPMTLEQIRAQIAKDAANAEAPAPSAKPMTLEEIRRQAQEQLKNEDEKKAQ